MFAGFGVCGPAGGAYAPEAELGPVDATASAGPILFISCPSGRRRAQAQVLALLFSVAW